MPAGFKEAWKALFEAGWRTLAVDEKHGGQAGPFTLAMMVEEFMCGSNTSFNMYPALTQGAADVILAFGTPEQQATYVPEHVQRQVGGHDVPHRAARRQRRRQRDARTATRAPTARTTSRARRSSSPAAIRT